MNAGRFKDREHLFRLGGLAVAGVLVFLLVQALLVPKGFGVYGHFRAGALDDNRVRKASFAGRTTCEACHSDVVDARKGGKHAGIGCEACHGPLASHAEADDPAATKPARPDATLCPICHTANVAKPEGFPQVDLKSHGEGGSCLSCHQAHQPGAAPEAKP
jgi:hypothetical protein